MDNNLLTGFIGTGGVGIDIEIFEVDLKGGFFYFNIHDYEQSSNRDRMGIINAIKADLDIPGSEVVISANISAYGSTVYPEAAVTGRLCLCACLEADTPFGSIGYLLTSVSVGCSISSRDGFSFKEFDMGVDAGLGDCPCDEDPCSN